MQVDVQVRDAVIPGSDAEILESNAVVTHTEALKARQQFICVWSLRWRPGFKNPISLKVIVKCQHCCTDLMWSVKLTSTASIKLSCHQKLDSSVPLYRRVVLISFDLHLVQVFHEGLDDLQMKTAYYNWETVAAVLPLQGYKHVNLLRLCTYTSATV